MQPGEVASLRYLPPENLQPITCPAYNINSIPTFHFGSLFPPHTSAGFPPVQQIQLDLAAPCVSNNNNSTSEDADDDRRHRSLVDERKRRRMISNRESARRSRMRKQRHLDDLWSRAVHLRAVNRRLIDELNRAIGDRDRMLLENSRLREEASVLREKLGEMDTESTSAGSALLDANRDGIPCKPTAELA